MIKKILINQIKPGVYVSNLNCGWMDHPFFKSQFVVKDDKMIKKIIGCGVKELYIDTKKGVDIVDAMTEQDVQEETTRQIKQVIAAKPATESKPKNSRTFVEEIKQAKKVFNQAVNVVEGTMRDSRMGKQINIEKIDHVVDNMTDSILSNANAMISLSRIRHADEYTFEHSVSVATFLMCFAKNLNFSPEIVHKIGTGGLLHDIGKMRIPNKILNKPSKLTDDEFALIQSHVIEGVKIIKELSEIDAIAAAVVAEHHERFDGSGYPNKKKANTISRYGQIAAIVDVYDAITSDRCYHKGMLPTTAMSKMMEWSKYHFNPKLVQAFIRSVGIYPPATVVRLDSGRIGIVLDASTKNLLTPVVRIVFDTKTNTYLKPFDLDLASSKNNAGSDSIVGPEKPGTYKIKPEKYLELVP